MTLFSVCSCACQYRAHHNSVSTGPQGMKIGHGDQSISQIPSRQRNQSHCTHLQFTIAFAAGRKTSRWHNSICREHVRSMSGWTQMQQRAFHQQPWQTGGGSLMHASKLIGMLFVQKVNDCEPSYEICNNDSMTVAVGNAQPGCSLYRCSEWLWPCLPRQTSGK